LLSDPSKCWVTKINAAFNGKMDGCYSGWDNAVYAIGADCQPTADNINKDPRYTGPAIGCQPTHDGSNNWLSWGNNADCEDGAKNLQLILNQYLPCWDPRYTGPDPCTTTVTTTTVTTTTTTTTKLPPYVYGAIAGGALLLVLGISLAVYCFQKRKLTRHQACYAEDDAQLLDPGSSSASASTNPTTNSTLLNAGNPPTNSTSQIERAASASSTPRAGIDPLAPTAVPAGTASTIRCPACQAPYMHGKTKFCRMCGTLLANVQSPSPKPQPQYQ